MFGFPIGQLLGANALVVIDVPNNRGSIRYRDAAKFADLWNRYSENLKRFRNNKTALRKSYSDARAEMTSFAFWKRYLNLA